MAIKGGSVITYSNFRQDLNEIRDTKKVPAHKQLPLSVRKAQENRISQFRNKNNNN